MSRHLQASADLRVSKEVSVSSFWTVLAFLEPAAPGKQPLLKLPLHHLCSGKGFCKALPSHRAWLRVQDAPTLPD